MKYRKIKLSNGLRVITVPMQGTQTVTVVAVVGVGSRYEKDSEAGISHFIEHMFFKGTQKRPTPLSITEELDSIGGEFNAFTSKDKTGYYTKVDAKHLDTALDVMSDIYLNSKIEKSEIEREKGTIIQELNMYQDTPIMNVADVFEELLYHKSSLGREIVGNKKTVASFKRSDFVAYMNRFYVANDTVICVAGKFNEKIALKKIKEYFSKMKRGVKPRFGKIFEAQTKPAIQIKYKKTDQTHLLLGVRAYRQEHPDRFALGILSVILGGNMSSRLFTEIREKKGLAYRITTNVEAYQDCGYLATQAGIEHKNLRVVIETILREYKKIAREKVNQKELQNAKDFIKGKSVMGLEASEAVAMFYVDQEMRRKKIMSMDEIFRRIDKVTAEDVLRVAKNIFQNKKLNLAAIGPHKDGKKLEKILKI